MAYEHESGSADGRFELQCEAWEAASSHWVFAPRLVDKAHGRVLLQFAARQWSIDSSDWNGHRVRLALRKYPGNQQCPALSMVLDCGRETGRIEGDEAVPLRALEARMDEQIKRNSTNKES